MIFITDIFRASLDITMIQQQQRNANTCVQNIWNKLILSLEDI